MLVNRNICSVDKYKVFAYN